jgi:hypothetical protein
LFQAQFRRLSIEMKTQSRFAVAIAYTAALLEKKTKMAAALRAKVESFIQANSRSEELHLPELGIESIEPFLASLARMTRLRRLNLSKNKITSLPDDLSDLQNLESLDLSGNPIASLQSVLRGLLCLRGLKHLRVNLPYESDEDEVIVNLHTLESFNGTLLTEGAEVPPPSSGPNVARYSDPSPSAHMGGMSPSVMMGASASAAAGVSPRGARWEDGDHMAQVLRLYNAANSVSGRTVSRAEFDDYTRNVVGHLDTLLQAEEDPYRREGEILKAKRIMFEYCFDEVTRSSHRFDANLGAVLGVLQDTYANLLEHYDRVLKAQSEDKERKLSTMKADMQHAIREIETLMQQMDARGGAGDGAAAAAVQSLRAARETWEAERKKLTDELSWLKTENEKLSIRVRQAEITGRATTVVPSQSLAAVRSATIGSTVGASPRGPSTAGGPAPIAHKQLTLRQLRDVIEDIYASKSKFDIKCAETKLPRETMEQHMYTYLNQRYGLKHLILEWATAIVQGIKRYAAEDNDVAVFGKILRNEVDEEFRFVQRQLKETVHELLRVYLKGKHPLKGDEDLSQMLRKRVNGSVSEDEWIDIVKYMYNTEDSISIIMRIKDILKQKVGPVRRIGTSRRAAKEEAPQLLYAEFLRTLLDFQLEGHERFLAKFVRVFKQFDSDRNGVINEQEFRSVIKAIDASKSDEEVNTLLDLIDPNNNQLINFSECVTFLSSELVKLSKEDVLSTVSGAR